MLFSRHQKHCAFYGLCATLKALRYEWVYDTRNIVVLMVVIWHQKHCGFHGLCANSKTPRYEWAYDIRIIEVLIVFLRDQKHCGFLCATPKTLRYEWDYNTGNIVVLMVVIIIININPLTARVVGAPQMILQPVFSIFPCSPLPSGACRTPGLSIPWCCLPTSSFVRLVFFHLSLSYDTRNIVVLTVVIRHQKPCASNAFFPWRFHKPFGGNGLLTIPETFRFCWSPRDTNNIVVVMTFLRHERHLLDVTDLHASS